MPNLKVELVLAIKSFAGIFKNCRTSIIDGIVASPTPIVGIFGDSMSSISQPELFNDRDKIEAAIQPAVPPPTITYLLIFLSLLFLLND